MKRIFTFVLIGLLWMLGESKAMASLQLASPITVSKSDIAYKEAFTVSATVSNQGAGDYTGQLGLALYDADNQLFTVLDAQSVTIVLGGSQACVFSVASWSELMAGQYYIAIHSKNSLGEWEPIAAGGYENSLSVRIGVEDFCTESTLIYECTFEQDPLGWTFDRAAGINSGFAIGGASYKKMAIMLYL